jgi:tetratricopeptide (TPR) repeat protein
MNRINGAEWPIRAGSEVSVTKTEKEVVDMRKAHLFICAVLLLFCLRTFAQGSSRGGSAKQDAPKVIETDDMKLAMKASKAEASGNDDEALKLYGEAIEFKGRFTPFVYQNRGMLYLHRAKAAQDRQSRIADLRRAIADFQTSIRLGAASKDELNHGLEKVATRTNLDEATKLLARETHPIR